MSPKWLEFRRKGFWPPAKREGKSTAARRVAPKMALGFVASRSQVHGDMLPRRASPKAILGATKHQPFRRHYPRRGVVFWGGQRNAGLDGGLPTAAQAGAGRAFSHPSPCWHLEEPEGQVAALEEN